jgi:anti-sigma factor RsiW
VSELSPERTAADTPLNMRRNLIAYVSARFDPSERDAFEQRLLDDEDFSQQISLTEEDLLEDYAGGLLEPATHEALHPWIMNSERRRAKVQLIQAMRLQARKMRAQQMTRRWLAVAACVLTAVGLAIWHGLRPSTPEPSVASRVSPPAPPKPDVILLAAERVRGTNAPVEATYVVHNQTPVSLQVLLSESAAGPYSLEIHSATVHSNWPAIHATNLMPQLASGVSFLEVKLPANRIPTGEYSAAVRSPSGTSISRFRVQSEEQASK